MNYSYRSMSLGKNNNAVYFEHIHIGSTNSFLNIRSCITFSKKFEFEIKEIVDQRIPFQIVQDRLLLDIIIPSA